MPRMDDKYSARGTKMKIPEGTTSYPSKGERKIKKNRRIHFPKIGNRR